MGQELARIFSRTRQFPTHVSHGAQRLVGARKGVWLGAKANWRQSKADIAKEYPDARRKRHVDHAYSRYLIAT